MNPESVDDAITQVLMENGPTSSNKLHRFVEKKFSCTEKTCRKHVNIMVEQGKIRRKEIGQYVEYSLSGKEKEFVSKSTNFLDELIQDSNEYFPNVLKILKTFEKKKKSNLKTKIRLGIFYNGLDSSNIILNYSKLLSLIIIAGFSTSETKQKAKELQKKIP